MIAAWEFESASSLPVGLGLAALTLTLSVCSHIRRGLRWPQLTGLTALRAGALFTVVFLLARPVRIEKPPPGHANRPVALLLDRSESMSLEEGGATRYQQALEFAQRHLMPALREAGLPLRILTFADGAELVDVVALTKVVPDGQRTDLGTAIVRAANAAEPPLAVIACTDGAANETADNQRALSALAETRVPFIGVGFGTDQGTQTLSLRQAEAPAVVPPKTGFNVSAYLEANHLNAATEFALILLRDGTMTQQKTVQAGAGSRVWLESFQVTEQEEGAHQYAVQLLPPGSPRLKCVSTASAVAVRIRAEKELRMLFVQGALTWDYKFITLALKSDPSIKVTGLTRTSEHSVFRQNVESSKELLGGFPKTIEEMAPFRVVVLSNLKPAHLSSAQQELLGRYCSELGGGLFLVGGGGTFDRSWQGSRLEQMLPVILARDQGMQGLDRAFRLQLTEEAAQHPVFQISEDQAARQVWLKVPTFTQYARVDDAKAGAQVWAVHAQDSGPKGRRILLASQRYGAGQTAALCVQNFWRWRLAKDAEPQQFDRFWRQFFRFLAEARREEVAIHLADQDLRPQKDVQITLEKQPNPHDAVAAPRKFLIRVENDRKASVREESVELQPGRSVDLRFRAESAGLYTVSVQDQAKQPIASRTIEIRDMNVEFLSTGRNMENLRQWASLSEGLAVKVEDCRDAAELVRQIKAKIDQVRQGRPFRQPVGMSAWTLGALLACLGGEWLLRKRWGLI